MEFQAERLAPRKMQLIEQVDLRSPLIKSVRAHVCAVGVIIAVDWILRDIPNT